MDNINSHYNYLHEISQLVETKGSQWCEVKKCSLQFCIFATFHFHPSPIWFVFKTGTVILPCVPMHNPIGKFHAVSKFHSQNPNKMFWHIIFSCVNIIMYYVAQFLQQFSLYRTHSILWDNIPDIKMTQYDFRFQTSPVYK